MRRVYNEEMKSNEIFDELYINPRLHKTNDWMVWGFLLGTQKVPLIECNIKLGNHYLEPLLSAILPIMELVQQTNPTVLLMQDNRHITRRRRQIKFFNQQKQ